MRSAVLYLRSSKDRHDVSIESQRHELAKLAAERGFMIATEFRDVVESGKDDDRPAFQELLEAVRRRDRGWDTILVLDTSRLARRLAAAVKFEEECRPLGVTIIYKSLPQAEDAERALIKSVFHGVDEWHSLVSKRKGIAGMRENVKAGFRAGGRAPFGYKLEYIDTGKMREGRPVLKTRLVASADAPKIQRYLRARAEGNARTGLVQRLALDKNKSALVGIEWNALTYAGHTVWNVHNERLSDGYEGGTKRRPRKDWEIRRDTHAALITTEQAEQILARLEAANARRPRRTNGEYLFTGLLKTSAGVPWHGERRRWYRTGNDHARVVDVDHTLLHKIAHDLRSSAFTAQLVKNTRSSYGREFDRELARLTEAEGQLDARIARFMDMAEKEQVAPEPVLRKVNELELDRKRIARELEQARRDASIAVAARAVTENQVARMLDAMAGDMARLDRDRLKDFLFTVCEGITLNAGTLAARIHYKIPLSRRDRLASPRGSEPIPHAKATGYVLIRRAA